MTTTNSDDRVTQTLDMEEEDFSDEHVHQILRAAEQRLRSVAQAKQTDSETDISLSRLSTSISTGPKGCLPATYIKSNGQGGLVDPVCLVSNKDRKLADAGRNVEVALTARHKASKEKKATAGSDWYNLPRTNLTPELKRDLQLLRMRSVLDPKRHYKRESGKKSDVPEFSQVGTIIQGPTEFFTARLTNKDRKRTLVEEVLAGEKHSQRFKSKYNDIQKAKTSGKKAHYKAILEKRAHKSSKG